MTVPPVEPRKSYRVQIIVAVIGACAVVLAALIPVALAQLTKPEPTPTPTPVSGSSPVSSPPADPPTPETTEPPRQPAADEGISVPEDYRGTWSGTIVWRAPMQGSYTTTLTITAGSLGTMVGQFSAANGTCRGAVWLVSGGGPIVVRLQTTYDGGGCSQVADAKLTLNDDELAYDLVAATFVNGYVNSPSPPAQGVLKQE
ncbi:hypothetical protein ACFOY2_08040 [Nonomuraea purpurea]|uniref:Serine/threonine protein kinase n=1 Tax=Nonomuraea purpurea TaxID=1849276 RepID=A0ABV8G3Q1_9ACTN